MRLLLSRGPRVHLLTTRPRALRSITDGVLKPSSPHLSSKFTSRHTSSAPSLRYCSNMDAQELSNYYADSPPTVVRLEIAKHFDALTEKQKRYAHFISR